MVAFRDRGALMEGAARHVVELANLSIAKRRRFSWALSGGSTSRPLYAQLANARLDWARVHFFWGDERCVPPDDLSSNYRMARETLLDAITPAPAQVHRMHGEQEPVRAAMEYEQMLHRFFDVPAGGGPPILDLVLLGMGSEGHTASLFPGASALAETQRWVVASYVEALAAWRLTLTPVIINAAAHVVFLVSGASKATRLKEVLQPNPLDGASPAQLIQPTHGDLMWMIDDAAAVQLQERA